MTSLPPRANIRPADVSVIAGLNSELRRLLLTLVPASGTEGQIDHLRRSTEDRCTVLQTLRELPPVEASWARE